MFLQVSSSSTVFFSHIRLDARGQLIDLRGKTRYYVFQQIYLHTELQVESKMFSWLFFSVHMSSYAEEKQCESRHSGR